MYIHVALVDATFYATVLQLSVCIHNIHDENFWANFAMNTIYGIHSSPVETRFKKVFSI